MIRSYVAPDDALPTLVVFTRAVRETARLDYTLEQVMAWAPSSIPVQEWDARRSAQDTRLFVEDHAIAGFASMGADGYLDMLFVHPEFTRRGVALALLEAFGDGPMWTNASITARGFFERQGFVVVATQQISLRGQVLTNYRMSRD